MSLPSLRASASRIRGLAGALGVALLAVVTAADAAAQALVVGTVTAKGRPVADAEIMTESDARTRTTPDGRFELTVPGGLVRLAVRAIGYYPTGRRLMVVSGDTVESHFTLDPMAQELDSITIEATAPVVRGKMAAFEERRAAGLGRFYTRADLAPREHSTLANVLRMTPGLQLVARPCGGFSVATGRGGATEWQSWMRCPGRAMQAACYFTVYLDGVLYWAPGREPLDINSLGVHSLEAVEVYRGPAETPVQYQRSGTACGVLLLWSRVSPDGVDAKLAALTSLDPVSSPGADQRPPPSPPGRHRDRRRSPGDRSAPARIAWCVHERRTDS